MERTTHNESRALSTLLALFILGQLTGCLETDTSSESTSDVQQIDDPVATSNSDSNQAPIVANIPSGNAKVGETYVYAVDAEDPDGDPLTYKIQNRPDWLNWNKETGRLSGSPAEVDIGPHLDILITVTDQTAETVVGPFSIDVTASDKPEGSVSKVEPNFGHYISMNRYDDQSDMIRAIKPGIVGIQKRYYWKSLEPNLGEYEFSELQSDLDLLADQGLHLVVFVEDKTFNGIKPTPTYLQGEYTLQNRNGGFTAKRWDPYVAGRFKQLIAAIGERFDNHPAFEGVAIQESSLSLNDSVLDANDYTPEKYRDTLIDVLKHARTSMPRSQVFWYMNFLPRKQSYIADIANSIASDDIAMGGPDVLPDEHALQEHSYPFYPEFRDKMVLFNSMQYNSYAHVHKDTSYATKYWTMAELLSFAKADLHVSYLFWNRKVRPDPEDSYDWTDALTAISDEPYFYSSN